MIYQWKWLRPRAGSDTGAVMIFQMSMYYLSFAPLWILVFLTDIFSICDNDKYLVTEYISIVLILLFMVIALWRMRNKLNSKSSDNVKCICLAIQSTGHSLRVSEPGIERIQVCF